MSNKTIAAHLIERILYDPRLAYYFDPIGRSMEILTEDYAKEQHLDVEEFRKSFYARLKFERPRCSDCNCSKCKEGK